MKLPRQNIHAYHLDQSLLYQFILSEILSAAEATMIIKTSLAEAAEHLVSKVSLPLHKLAGSGRESMRMLVWNHDDGILSKLQLYFGHYFQLSPEEKGYSITQKANQTWLLGLKCLEKLRGVTHETDENTIKELFKNLKELIKNIRQLSNLAIHFLDEYQRDENVMFFLIRNVKQFDTFFGQGFTNKFLIKVFPEGLAKAESFLYEKYYQRGFTRILPLITSKIADLTKK